MVNADLGSEDELQSELKRVEGVVGVYQVYGVYDMVVEVEAESDQKLKEILFSRIRCAQAREVHAHPNHDVLIQIVLGIQAFSQGGIHLLENTRRC